MFTVSNPAKDNELLMAIEIRSTTSFGGEVKPSVPCRKVLRRIKKPYRYGRDTSKAKFTAISL
jgi:hypothetical protein